MTLTVITPPLSEPLPPADVLASLGLPASSLPYATTLAQAARQGVEQAIAGVLPLQTLLWQTVLTDNSIMLPVAPVVSIASVTLNGVPVASTAYTLRNNALLFNTTLGGALSVQFVAGYTLVPAALLLAVQQLVMRLHQGLTEPPTDTTWQALLMPYKTMRLV